MTTQCYICYDETECRLNPIVINPCECKGSLSIHKNCLQDIFTQHNTSPCYSSFAPPTCSICKSPYKTYKHPPPSYENGFPVLQFPDSYMYGTVYIRGAYNPNTMTAEGRHIRYYQGQQGTYILNEQTYVQGKRHGLHRRYYLPPDDTPDVAHGPLECEETYVHDQLHGIQTTYWFGTGQKYEQRVYRKGDRHGIQQKWTEQGDTEGPIIYLWGQEVPLCTWVYNLFTRAKSWFQRCNTHQTPEYTQLSD